MDSPRNVGSEEQSKKKMAPHSPEVVLVISNVGSSSPPRESELPKESDPKTKHLPLPSSSPAREISKPSPNYSPRKPPPIPPTPKPHPARSISGLGISKPKSRFVEHSPPRFPLQSSVAAAEPKENLHSGAATPKTPKSPRSSTAAAAAAAEEDEDEDELEDVYQKEPSSDNTRRRRRRRICCVIRMVAEWSVLAAATACLVASNFIRPIQGFSIWGLEIWKWCVMAIVVCSGRLISHWLVVLLVFLIERNFLFKKKVLYFVYGLKNSVQISIWLGLVLLSWSILFQPRVRRSQGSQETTKALQYVSSTLISLLVGSVLWLVKTFLVKLLASDFHVNTFFDRIQESIFHQYLLQTLFGPPVMEIAEKLNGGDGGPTKSLAQLSFRSMRKGKVEREQGVIDVGKLHKLRQEKVSAWTMKGLISAILGSRTLTISNAIDESEMDEEQRDWEITSEWQARAAARQIFKNVAKPGCKYIEVEDLLRFLRKEEVDVVLPLFEGASETGTIKKSALKHWVVKAYLDRKSLALSLNDTKTAVKQLHKLATAIVFVVIIMISLLIMGIATTKVFVFLSSQLLLVAFMFGNTCKTIFEAIIFVFVMHPFDVGDRCVIDGVQMIVEEMNILTTVFLRYDNEKIYYPNTVLATKPISNFYRSPDMGDSVEFSIDFSTSVETLGLLKAKVKSYIESKPHHWHPNHSMVVKGIVDVNKMNMTLYVNHTMNYQNIPEKNNRRSELIIELKKIFEELTIQYNLLPQDVRLSHAEPTAPPLTIGR